MILIRTRQQSGTMILPLLILIIKSNGSLETKQFSCPNTQLGIYVECMLGAARSKMCSIGRN